MKGLNLGGVAEFCRVLVRQPQLLLPQLSVKGVRVRLLFRRGRTHANLCLCVAADVTEVPFQTLKDRGFRGVIFDKDNTLTAPHRMEVAPQLAASLAECRRVFGDAGVVIFSNSAGSNDDPDFAEAKRIEEGLHVAVLRHNQKTHFGDVDPTTLVIIGDRYSTDVLFGNLHGLLTIRTEQFVPEDESVVNRQLQCIEKAAVRLLERSGVTPPTHPLWSGEAAER
ncbi:hypothetical protein BBJ28_00014135 [Nothophytophthora sp. Chile5]|nr:hypothetical protein BBJ28_00014135 [Nothophytophthora sp. Chile5]